MRITVNELKMLCDKLIKDGFKDYLIMLVIPTEAYCELHEHELNLYTEILHVDLDMEKKLLLFESPMLPDIETIQIQHNHPGH